MDGLLAFLNSGLGLMLVGAVIGAIGLFTWQRRDWVFKQAYLRNQVMLDRRLKVVEAVNADIGAYLVSADGVIAAFMKGVGTAQRNQVVSVYNERQATWFGAAPSHAAMLGFYFPPRIAEGFTARLVEETERLDIVIYRLTVGEASADAGHEVSKLIRARLREWNDAAIAELTAA